MSRKSLPPYPLSHWPCTCKSISVDHFPKWVYAVVNYLPQILSTNFGPCGKTEFQSSLSSCWCTVHSVFIACRVKKNKHRSKFFFPNSSYFVTLKYYLYETWSRCFVLTSRPKTYLFDVTENSTDSLPNVALLKCAMTGHPVNKNYGRLLQSAWVIPCWK